MWRRVVLTVAVEVHDEVGARGERGVHAGPEGGDETAVRRCRSTRSAPAASATTAVPSLEPSSTTMTSTSPTCGIRRGTAATPRRRSGLVQRGNDNRELEAVIGVGAVTDVRVGRQRPLWAVDALDVPRDVEAIEPRLVEAGAAGDRLAHAVAGVRAVVAGLADEHVRPAPP